MTVAKELDVVAFIPARSGSKGLVNKNIADLHGLPVIAYSVLAAKKCKQITSNSIKFSIEKTTSIYDIPYFVTDNSKVSNLYKWKPKKNIDDIIYETYLWMKMNLKKLKKNFK